LNLRPPGPETKEISQIVDFSIHVSGASTVQTHVIPARRSHSFSYGCPRVGAPPPIDGSGFLQLSFLLAWRVGVSPGTAGTLTNIHASSTEIAMLRPGARSGANPLLDARRLFDDLN